MFRVLLVASREATAATHMLRGVSDFTLHDRNWACTYAYENAEVFGHEGPRFDGVLAFAWQRTTAEASLAYGRPVVSVYNVDYVPGLPRVGCDEDAIGRSGAQYLLDRGFMRLGYYGAYAFRFSKQREAGCRAVADEAGVDVSVFDPDAVETPGYHALYWLGVRDSTRQWVRQLVKPVGVLCASDHNAAELVMACREMGFRVPEDVAILGVENDEIFCGMSVPPLSSIATPHRRVGFEAAALLDRMMRGEPPPAAPVLLPPVGVVPRQSTDIFAIEDPDVVTALSIIRKTAPRALSVSSILAQVPIARRTLEQRFRELLGRSPHEEIMRVRLNHAKDLLASTDLPMSEVAKLSGFKTSARLSIAFRDQLRTTPSAYRRRLSPHGLR